MSRPDTPDVETPTGTVMHVKRVCDGCWQQIGDVTDQEMNEAVAGLPLFSVAAEHGCGKPANLPIRPDRSPL